MRRIATWGLSTITMLVLLFGYHTSTTPQLSTRTRIVAAAPSASASPHTTKAPTTRAKTHATKRTVTGPVVQTRWGPVQVRVTSAKGRITDVVVVQAPSGNQTDHEINAQALPLLVRETLTAQSARVDMVSGATVTSQGYLTSLQGALDQAGL